MAKEIYNGVEVNALPQWDKETYPYAFLISATMVYVLICCSEIPTPSERDGKLSFASNKPYITYTSIHASSGDGWYLSSDDEESFNVFANQIFWTNCDLKNPDGTIYLASSDGISAEPYTSEQYKYLLVQRLRRFISMTDNVDRAYTNSFFGQLFDGITLTEESYNNFIKQVEKEEIYCHENNLIECEDITDEMIETEGALLVDAFASVGIELKIEIVQDDDKSMKIGGDATFTKPDGTVMTYEVRGGWAKSKNYFRMNPNSRTEHTYTKLSAPYYNFKDRDIANMTDINFRVAGPGTYWSYDPDTLTMTITGDGTLATIPSDTQIGAGVSKTIVIGANVSAIEEDVFTSSHRTIVLLHSADAEISLSDSMFDDTDIWDTDVYCDNNAFREYSQCNVGIHFHHLSEWDGGESEPTQYGYTYNGVFLPIVHKIDSTTRHSTICVSEDGSYFLCATTYSCSMLSDGTALDRSGYYMLSSDDWAWVYVSSGLTGIPIWSNYPILNADSTTFLEPSAPVKDDVPLSLVRLTFKYNIPELPLLPEYDSTTYPYMLLSCEDDVYYLYLTNTKPTSTSIETSSSKTSYKVSGKVIVYSAIGSDDEEWTYVGSYSSYSKSIIRTNVKWANCELTYTYYNSNTGKSYTRTHIYARETTPANVYEYHESLVTTYLYNGLELPALPEWDKETYPYAYISYMYNDTDTYKESTLYTAPYQLVFSSQPASWLTYTGSSFTLYKLDCTNSVSTIRYEYRPYLTVGWAQHTYDHAIASKYSNKSVFVVALVWTNTDTRSYDDSILIAASEPIPTTSEPIPDITGTIVGDKTGKYGVEIDYTAVANRASNSSEVTAEVYITYYSIDIGSRTGKCTINGAEHSFATESINHNAGEAYRKLVATVTETVPHNADGTKTCTISASFPFLLTSSTYGEISTLTASADVELAQLGGGNTSKLVPGLYETGTTNLIYSWDQLLGDEIREGGVLTVTDGAITSITKGFGGIYFSYSSAYLAGDLVLAVDGSVTSLKEAAFYSCKQLTSIAPLPTNIDTIPSRAFNGCTSLSKIDIPESVKNIGSTDDMFTMGAFYGCTALTEIQLPKNLEVLGNGTFHGCEGITEIVLPDTLKTIGSYALFNTGISTISIPDSVEELDNPAIFSGCENLTDVYIGSGVSSMDGGDYPMFAGCPLERITVSEANTTYRSIGNHIIEIATNTLVLGSLCTIPDDENITSIGSYAFSQRPGLTSIVIPDHITEINWGAFYLCDDLTEITIGSGLTSANGSMCMDCYNLSEIIVSADNTTYRAINNHLIDVTSKTLTVGANNGVIPDDGSVTAIGQRAFLGRKGFDELIIPSHVTEIGVYSFADCTDITTITYLGTVAQWALITLGSNWNSKVPATQVNCSDGTVTLST